MTTANVEASSMDSARSSLMDSIRNSTPSDFSGYKDDRSTPQVDSSSETATENNDTGDRGDSVEVEQQAQTSSQNDASQADITKTDGDVTTRTEPTKKPRAQDRIQELAAQNKELKAKLEQANAKKPEVAVETKAKEPPKPRVPQPTPPQFTKEVLSNLLLKYRAEGNQDMVDQIHAEQEKWRQHDIDMVRWEFKNGTETEKHNGAVQYYKQEALKAFPGLNDAASPITREYTGVRGWLNQKVPEIFDLPEAEYLVAQIANWKLASGQVATSQAEIKKLNEELGKLKKGSLPITTSSKPEVGGKDDSPAAGRKDAERALKDSIRRIQGVGMTM